MTALPRLADLFPDGDYRFHLTLRRAEPRSFFMPWDPSGAILRERVRWIEADPARHLAVGPGGEVVVAEFLRRARHWIPDTKNAPAGSGLDAVRWLGESFEPDLLFLLPDAQGRFCLRAGALCFPTGWALTEKLGQPLDVIHGIVPGLNAAIGDAVRQFLGRMKPGIAFLRDNWGIAATDELNLHPARDLPAPALPTSLERLWLRVEHQALCTLPESHGLVFGIRIALHRMDAVARDPAAKALRRALATMPAELAAYKRLDVIRPYLLNVL